MQVLQRVVLSNAEDNTSGSLNRGGIADLPLLRTLLPICLKFREPSFWEVMESFVLLAYASFAAARNLLHWLLACLNFTLDAEDLSFWCKWKKWFLWTMAVAQAACYILWGIYTSIPNYTHLQNSLTAAEAPSLKISAHGTSLKWSGRPSQSERE